MTPTSTTRPPATSDWVLFLLAPVFFSSNIIFGRGILGEIGPFITAFIRWFGAALLILGVMIAQRVLQLRPAALGVRGAAPVRTR